MKPRLLFYIYVCIALCVFVVIMYLTRTDVTKNRVYPIQDPIVSVYFSPTNPTPTVQNQLFSPENIPPVIPTKETIENATESINENDNPCIVRIQDAMGEAIQQGVIKMGGESHPFQEGCFIVPNTTLNECQLEVSAEGYFPVQQTIAWDDSRTKIITMEYHCDFEFKVYEMDKKTLCKDAVVMIWKVCIPERPIQNDCRANFSSTLFPIGRFGWNHHQCTVTQYNNKSTFPLTPNSLEFALQGDVLRIIGNCKWNPDAIHHFPPPSHYLYKQNPKSQKLRIWDTLVLSGQREPQSDCNHWVEYEFQRETSYARCFLQVPDYDEQKDFLCNIKINDDREYKIENLEPALYYAQAVKGSQKSESIPLFPCCNGGILTLENTSSIRIDVIRKGHNKNANLLYNPIENANVTIKSTENGLGIFSGITQNGYVQFDRIPYGIYEVQVTPPTEVSFKKVKKEVTIDKPNMTLVVEIDEWTHYSISGVVFNHETKEPVKGYAIRLHNQNGSEGYDIQISDDQGLFMFQNVIAGEYYLKPQIESYDQVQYLPFVQSVLTGLPFIPRSDMQTTAVISVNVQDQNVSNIQIPVKEPIRTKFTGIVKYENGSPAVGFYITVMANTSDGVINTLDAQTIPSDCRTDQQGNFLVTILKEDSMYEYNLHDYHYTITAMDGQFVPAHWIDNGDSTYTLVPKVFSPSNSGVTKIIGKAGQDYHDIEICVKAKSDKTIYGRILSEEKDYLPVELYAYQNSLPLAVQKENDGTFQIDHVAEGEFLIDLRPDFREMINTPNGIYPNQKYITEKFYRTMPDDKQEMYMDITLRKAGYFWGFITDLNDNPLANVMMNVNNNNNTSSTISQIYTDSNGFFFITGYKLLHANLYQFICYNQTNQKEIYRTNYMISPIGNIKIQINNDKNENSPHQ